MTKEMFSKVLTRYVDTYSNAFIVGVFGKKEILYRNHIAEELYGISEGETDLEPIFQQHSQGLMEMVKEGLTGQDLMVWNNITTLSCDGVSRNADIQIGFFDEEKTMVCIEIIPKNDTRMEIALNQVKLSTRAEGILNYDDKLTLIHGNEAFFEVFEMDEVTRHGHYNNQFANGFQPEVRSELLEEIHENLEQYPTYFKKVKITTTKGKEKWLPLNCKKESLIPQENPKSWCTLPISKHRWRWKNSLTM